MTDGILFGKINVIAWTALIFLENSVHLTLVVQATQRLCFWFNILYFSLSTSCFLFYFDSLASSTSRYV